MENESAVEWFANRINIYFKNNDFLITYENEIYQAKEIEENQKKQLVIGTYLDLKMKNNKLSYGIEYLNKISDLEEEAEQYYNKNFKSK